MLLRFGLMQVEFRTRPIYLAIIGAMLAVGGPAAAQTGTVEPAALLRSAIDLACHAATGVEVRALRLQLPPVAGRSGVRPVSLSRLGWRGRFDVPGGRLTLERLAPGGRFQHISAQYDAREDEGPAAVDRRRPLLLAMTDGSCAIRTARRLHYDDDGRPAWLEWLDGLLEPTGEREELNPPVPDGADPGGVPVALVDTGVNYLLPAIAARLARDPDGALLGYDYWDLDRRPFDAHPVHSPFFPMRHGTQTASLLLAEAPVTRLLAYRYPRPDMGRMAALIEDAAAAGARLVNLSLVGNQAAEWAGFEAAALRHPEILFVAAAGNHGRDLDQRPAWPAALPLANLIAVTAARADGALATAANWGRTSVDLMVAAEGIAVTGFFGEPRTVSGSSYAAVRITALAACLLAAHPDWQAAELKAALFALARPPAEAGRVAIGLIPASTLANQGACSTRPPGSGV
jgi:hypothetical protein